MSIETGKRESPGDGARKALTYGLVLVLMGAAIITWWHWQDRPRQTFAYVACEDKRIYEVDIAGGKVITTSKMIEDMGRPTAADIDVKTGRLYVGSERGRSQNDYYPLVAVDVTHDFDVVAKYTLDRAHAVVDRFAPNRNVHAVYGVRTSVFDGRLYLGYAAPDYSGGKYAIFNPHQGEITGQTAVPILPQVEFFPDESKIASIWASQSKTVNGTVQKRAGGIVVQEVATGKTLSSIEVPDNRGLHPPWGKLSSPLVYLSLPDNILHVHNRDSGETIAALDLIRVTGMTPSSGTAAWVAHSGEVVLSMVKSNSDGSTRGFVVTIDPIHSKVVQSIEVGPHPTNAVVIQKP
jgi:hypothetical protein